MKSTHEQGVCDDVETDQFMVNYSNRLGINVQ